MGLCVTRQRLRNSENEEEKYRVHISDLLLRAVGHDDPPERKQSRRTVRTSAGRREPHG